MKKETQDILLKDFTLVLGYIANALIKFSIRATRCTEAPAFARSGKGSHHLVYCTQPYPVFTQETVSRTWTRDLTVT